MVENYKIQMRHFEKFLKNVQRLQLISETHKKGSNVKMSQFEIFVIIVLYCTLEAFQ